MALRWLAVLSLVVLAACEETKPANPFTIPEASSIFEVEVTRWKPGAKHPRQGEARSSDPEVIRRLLDHLAAHNTGYATRYGFCDGEDYQMLCGGDEFPSQQYTISFSSQAEPGVPLIVWIGPDWLGGVDEELEPGGKTGRQSRRRPLPPEERERLLALLPVEERY